MHSPSITPVATTSSVAGTPPASRRLPSVEAESRLLFGLRARLALAALKTMLAQARLRLTLVILLSALFWGSLYGLFYEGFAFLNSLHAEIISLLFNGFFSSLLLMLVFSNAILMYSGLYCSPESRLLITLPARPEAVFFHKFQESFWFSSWGFILLGSPMLVAYGVVRNAPWTYFLLLLPFMVAFVVIPATLGGMLCMATVACVPRLRMHALAIAITASTAGAIWLGWTALASARADSLSPIWFEQTMSRLAITEQKFFPSWWLASGLIESASGKTALEGESGALMESLRFLALLASNGLMLQLLAGWLAARIYRLGFSQLSAEVTARRPLRISWFDRMLTQAGTAAGRPLRILIVKDLRLFRRDIAQWSQFVIFFGLLGLYFLNIRSFTYNNSYATMIGFLNLAVVGLILSTFTTRFVFPMISLEGRRFWILNLLPVHRDQIVWSKFLFSCVGGTLPCCGLVLLSDMMLGIRWPVVAIHEICCLVLCMGLSGIAVGMGALLPDLRETSPSKISSGFGGTLALVLSSLFIMAVVLLAAVPTHLYLSELGAATEGTRRSDLVGWAGSLEGVWAGVAAVVVLGLVATLLPLFLGLRHFRHLEA